MGRRRFSIIIAPHNRTDSWKLTVSGWVLWLVAAVFFLGIAGPVSFGLMCRQYRAQSEILAGCRAENDRLVEANERIALLEQDLIALTEFQTKMRQWVGLPPDSTLFSSALGESASASGASDASPYLPGLPTGGWRWPAKGWISRGFGGPSGRDPGHFGIDIVAAKKERVRASRAGRVIFCGWDDQFGNLIIVDHGDGYETRYGHNSQLLVSAGDRVLEGEEIAVIGSTGMSSAPHLHFEVLKDGEPVDPMSVLPEQ